jgi:hypothetical protein
MSDVVNSANNTLGLAVLLGCVRTRKMDVNTVSSRQIVKRTIVELLAIVTVNLLKR